MMNSSYYLSENFLKLWLYSDCSVQMPQKAASEEVSGALMQ